MLPASLEVNYKEELKKCGDKIYRKNQYWEFINIETNPDLLEPLSYALSLTKKFIIDNKGVWFVNVKEKRPNYNELTPEQQKNLDKQLLKMIEHKYYFIRYNGLRMVRLQQLSNNFTIDPFSNKVTILLVEL